LLPRRQSHTLSTGFNSYKHDGIGSNMTLLGSIRAMEVARLIPGNQLHGSGLPTFTDHRDVSDHRALIRRTGHPTISVFADCRLSPFCLIDRAEDNAAVAGLLKGGCG
jgi:hypothetical protein